MTKTCAKCGETKPLCEFYLSAGGKDGHRNDCAECGRARNRAYRSANPGAVKAYRKTHYAENREAIAAKAKVYRRDNMEAFAARQRAYFHRNRLEIAKRIVGVRYGITPEQATEFRSQPCHICKIPSGDVPRLQRHLDHDHAVPGRLSLRGALCQTCNQALGHHEKGKLWGRTKDRQWREAADKYLNDYNDRLNEL